MVNVKDWIKNCQEEFLADLRALVRCPSVSKKQEAPYPFGEACHEALALALSYGERFGLETRNFHDYCGTVRIPGETGSTIGLFAHLDVVPAGEHWSQDPYEMTVKDGVLRGRGCADDKGPAMAALYALRCLAESGSQLRHSICLFFGCDEETGMRDVEHYLNEESDLPVISIVTDGSFSVCVGEKGHIIFRASCPIYSAVLKSLSAGNAPNSVPGEAQAVLNLPVRTVEKALKDTGIKFQVSARPDGTAQVVVCGKAAHAAFPEGSIHAQKRLAELLCASGLLEPETERPLRGIIDFLADDYGTGMGIACETPEFGKLTMVSGITRMEEGRLATTFDVRYPAGLQGEASRTRVANRLQAYGFTLESWDDSPGYYREPDTPAIQAMKDAAEGIWRRELPVYVMGGGTYARKLPNGVPFGPGLPRSYGEADSGTGRAHQPDEAIELEVLQKGIEIYIEALLALDNILD